jgi:hypothetical protein
MKNISGRIPKFSEENSGGNFRTRGIQIKYLGLMKKKFRAFQIKKMDLALG